MSQMSSNISVDIGSSYDSSPEFIASIYLYLISGRMIELPLYLSPLSALLRVSDNKFPSSKCVNVIISPVFSFEDVAQDMYDTSGCISIASI